MKILLWSDVHCHLHRPFARYEDGMNSRLLDGLRIIDHVTEVAKDCDHAIFLGDLFHIAPPPAPAFNEVFERVRGLVNACPTLMLAGNHDLRKKYYDGDPRDIPFLKFLEFIDGEALIPNARIMEVNVEMSSVLGMDQLKDVVSVFGFNHRREADAAELVKNAKAHDILVMHQEVFGADNEFGYTFRGGMHPDDLKKFKWVFTGHIHKPQILNERVVVVGAPLHIDFGDVGDRGFFILDTEKDDVEVVDTKFPRFVTLGHGEEAPDDGNFHRPEQAKEKKREALKIPDWQEAIEAYCRQQKHMEHVDAGRAIADATPKEAIVPQPFSIKRVELRNFGVFEEVEYDIDDGLHMVIGEILGVDGRSNGAGKTTLFEGILWTIYGRTSKGVRGASVMKRNRKRGKVCSGIVVFSSPSGKLRIHRVQKASGSTLEAWLGDHHEEGRVPDVQKWIIETLGADCDFAQLMMYFSQAKAEFFSEMGDADRKRFLGSILNLRWYELAEQEAKTQRDAAKDLLEAAQSDLNYGETVLEDLLREKGAAEKVVGMWQREHAEALDAAEAKISSTDVELQGAKKGVDEDRAEILTTKKSDLADAEAGHKKAVAVFEAREKVDLREATERFDGRDDEINTSLSELRAKRETFGPAAGLMGEMEKVQVSLQESLERERQIIADVGKLEATEEQLGKQADVLREKINAINNLETGVRCQTCGAEITADSKERCVAEMRKDLDGKVAEIEACRNVLLKTTEDLGAVKIETTKITSARETARLAITCADRLDTKISVLVTEKEGLHAQREAAIYAAEATVRAERVELNRDDDALRTRIEKKCADDLAELERTKQAEVTRLKEELKHARAESKRLGKEKNPHVEAMSRASASAEKREKENAQLTGNINVESGRVETFAFWVVGFGREGIQAALLHDFCWVFTAEVNDTLTQMGIGMSAELSPMKRLKKKGEVRDRTSYNITTATGEMEYQELSGGEKVRIDLASMLALNLIASRHFGIEDGLFGILVLDEIFSSLDEAGIEIIYQIINGFTARSIYVISHDPSMKSMFNKVLTVMRDGTESVLVT